MSISGLQMSKS